MYERCVYQQMRRSRTPAHQASNRNANTPVHMRAQVDDNEVNFAQAVALTWHAYAATSPNPPAGSKTARPPPASAWRDNGAALLRALADELSA